jgi:hypothetical protein
MRFISCARLLAIWALGSAALLSTFAAAEGASPGLRGATANITVVMDMAEAGNWTAPAGRNGVSAPVRAWRLPPAPHMIRRHHAHTHTHTHTPLPQPHHYQAYTTR